MRGWSEYYFEMTNIAYKVKLDLLSRVVYDTLLYEFAKVMCNTHYKFPLYFGLEKNFIIILF